MIEVTMLYSAREAADRLGISQSYIYLLVQLKKLTPIRTTPLMFTEQELQRFADHGGD